jgi:copper chaperone CopZ
MDDASSASIPPELQVVLDLELTIKGATAAVEHQKLQAALAELPGVKSVSFSGDRTAIEYDPEKITKARLTELIGAAGYSISGSDSAPPTPPIDSQA